MLAGFFEAIPEEIWAPFRGNDDRIGGRILLNNGRFPGLKKAGVAIIGIGPHAHQVRKEFYAMYWRFEKLEIADLGNLVTTDWLLLQSMEIEFVSVQFFCGNAQGFDKVFQIEVDQQGSLEKEAVPVKTSPRAGYLAALDFQVVAGTEFGLHAVRAQSLRRGLEFLLRHEPRRSDYPIRRAC